jgi:hypothetical protein
MCENIENIGYFQKNKKTILSLVGAGLLSGAVVIGGFFPYQDVAEVNKMPPDEKLQIPPHPIGMQDKLSPIMPRVKPMALLFDGWTSLGKIGNYDVKYRRFTSGLDYVYQFIGTYGASQLGFGCICANVSKTPRWQGMVDSQCDTSASLDNPLDLGDGSIMGSYSISGIPIPTGACCKSQPRVDGTPIPIVSCP